MLSGFILLAIQRYMLKVRRPNFLWRMCFCSYCFIANIFFTSVRIKKRTLLSLLDLLQPGAQRYWKPMTAVKKKIKCKYNQYGLFKKNLKSCIDRFSLRKLVSNNNNIAFKFYLIGKFSSWNLQSVGLHGNRRISRNFSTMKEFTQLRSSQNSPKYIYLNHT